MSKGQLYYHLLEGLVKRVVESKNEDNSFSNKKIMTILKLLEGKQHQQRQPDCSKSSKFLSEKLSLK
jgi:hypothetical protein